MTNFSELLNFGFNFFKKYYVQYFRLLLLPLMFALLGILILMLIQQIPKLAFLGLLSIPFICCAFWRGYLVTYALNYAAISYKNLKNEELKGFISKIEGKKLARFLTFCALVTIIAYLPSLIKLFKAIDIPTLIINPSSVLSNLSEIISLFLLFLVNSLILMPFLNFFNQAFFFKNENENYMDLFLNCYKKLDKNGLLLSIIFGFMGSIISAFHPLFYLISALMLNLITFSVNTLWFCERFERTTNI